MENYSLEDELKDRFRNEILHEANIRLERQAIIPKAFEHKAGGFQISIKDEETKNVVSAKINFTDGEWQLKLLFENLFEMNKNINAPLAALAWMTND